MRQQHHFGICNRFAQAIMHRSHIAQPRNRLKIHVPIFPRDRYTHLFAAVNRFLNHSSRIHFIFYRHITGNTPRKPVCWHIDQPAINTQTLLTHNPFGHSNTLGAKATSQSGFFHNIALHRRDRLNWSGKRPVVHRSKPISPSPFTLHTSTFTLLPSPLTLIN